MDAGRFLLLARRSWWLLILGMVVAAGAYIITSRSGTAPQSSYRASTTLLVVYEADAGQMVSVGSFAEMIKSRPVMEQAIAHVGLSDPVEAVQARVQVQVQSGTQLIKIVASGETARESEHLATGVAESFDRLHDEQDLPGSVSIYEPARAVQSEAASGAVPAVVLLAALFGLMVASGAVVTIDYLRDSIKTAKDAKVNTGLTVLVTIPAWFVQKGARRRLPANTEGTNEGAERYRMLRTSFVLRTAEEPASTVLFAAGLPGEGTSTTAANFAVALAQAGRRVALVDTNLRSPSLHEIFALPNEKGLTQALAEDELVLAVFPQPTEFESLAVITSGPAPPNPSELLASDRFDRLLALLRDQFDAVVLDSPPVLSITDATVLASKADATIIVVRAESTSHAQLEDTAESLRRASSRLLGVVLNRDISAVRFTLPRLRLGRVRAVRRGDAEADLRTKSTRQIAPRRETA